MNTITFYNGRRKEYKTYNEFSEARDVLRDSSCGFVSYYDADGDTHVCEFRFIRGGIECCGLWCDLMDAEPYDCNGEHYSTKSYEAAGDIVKFQRPFEFLGWSL